MKTMSPEDIFNNYSKNLFIHRQDSIDSTMNDTDCNFSSNTTNDMNNSFSYHCPYEHNVTSYGFSGLNPKFCPHRPGHSSTTNENIRQYSRRLNENLDHPKNTIHLDNVLKLKDKRTTIMIRHIPNKYTIELLMQEINSNFEGKYDVLYLPMDFLHNSNLGFAFINFIDPMHLIFFYDEFIERKWNLFNSGKRCQLVYGKLQGKNELLNYIKKRNGITSFSDNIYKYQVHKTFYINNDINRNPQQIEIPMKYYKVFVHYYQFALCRKKNEDVFIVEKYYNF